MSSYLFAIGFEFHVDVSALGILLYSTCVEVFLSVGTQCFISFAVSFFVSRASTAQIRRLVDYTW